MMYILKMTSPDSDTGNLHVSSIIVLPTPEKTSKHRFPSSAIRLHVNGSDTSPSIIEIAVIVGVSVVDFTSRFIILGDPVDDSPNLSEDTRSLSSCVSRNRPRRSIVSASFKGLDDCDAAA